MATATALMVVIVLAAEEPTAATPSLLPVRAVGQAKEVQAKAATRAP